MLFQATMAIPTCGEIDRPIRGGKDCGAQVLLLRDRLFAKIYDPLYYRFTIDRGPYVDSENEDELILKRDVAKCADNEYVAEVAAYKELAQTAFAGSITPRYFGSWNVTIPIKHASISMQCIRRTDLTPEQRERIMFKVIEAQSDLEFVGIIHEDFEPRNILLSSSGPRAPRDGDILPIDSNPRVCVNRFG
ncbi:hypothetical protein T440DRAFT_482743 [Plenodomus tracheiphilus IPT5]|uniref:Protein kinase domain-containing protein n=1 Tax=Plenodomus tracheiphilus IPT5 TaxID=1408161 RepID=A0A6A7AVH1_9PLEO|nr:hypothetical protein T440DRAFT_482743 [Plenodomus tracheiphilus IPT5]